MSQQVSASAWSDAGDVFQPAGTARLLPASAMAGDGESVGLVAYLLDQLQRGGRRPGLECATIRQQQGFITGLARGALGHPD